MDISILLEEYARKKKFPSTIYDAKTAKNLLVGESESSLKSQEEYSNSEYLAYNIKVSVSKYSRNKDVAIHIYKDFLEFLRRKGIAIEIKWPPIMVSNTFERLMFISKYLQDPRHKVADLPDLLWISSRTIENDIKKLRGEDEDPIQICGKVFNISGLERNNGSIHFPSTAHPIFLTPNLTQTIIMLKGLKVMSENPLFEQYARLTATDIWEQLSDYAKTRVNYVLSELLPDDLEWYKSLKKCDEDSFYSEVRCSDSGNVILDCMKNDKPFCIEYRETDKVLIYNKCYVVPRTYKEDSVEVICSDKKLRIYFDRIIRSAYSAEELL